MGTEPVTFTTWFRESGTRRTLILLACVVPTAAALLAALRLIEARAGEAHQRAEAQRRRDEQAGREAFAARTTAALAGRSRDFAARYFAASGFRPGPTVCGPGEMPMYFENGTPPASFELTFARGQLTSCAAMPALYCGTGDLSAFERAARTARSYAFPTVAALSALGCATAVALGAWRRTAVDIALVAAALCGLILWSAPYAWARSILGVDIWTIPPSLLALALVLAAWFRWPPRRRLPWPACASCGYNLTGNTSGVCPECGRPISGGAVQPTRALPAYPS